MTTYRDTIVPSIPKEKIAEAVWSLEENGALPEGMEVVFAPLKCEE